MASIKTKLDTRRANERGEFPVKIVICNNQTNASLSLNFYLPRKAWEKDGLRRPVKSTHSGAKTINNRIEERYAEILNVIIDLERQGTLSSMKAVDIKKLHN
jgi:hypothetical protein